MIVSRPAITPAVHGADKHIDVTRELFIHAFDDSDANATLMNRGRYAVIEIADGVNNVYTHFSFKVPDDFVSFGSIELVWIATPAAGNLNWNFHAYYGASGESYVAHTDTPAIGVTATIGANRLNVQEPANPLTMASLAIGDDVGLRFERDGLEAEDTIDDVISILGILFTYTAEQ